MTEWSGVVVLNTLVKTLSCTSSKSLLGMVEKTGLPEENQLPSYLHEVYRKTSKHWQL